MSIKNTLAGIVFLLLSINVYSAIITLGEDDLQYQECKNLAPSPINQIEVAEKSPTIDHSLSAYEIAKLRKRLVGFSDTKNHGMTYAKLRHQFHISGKARKLVNGKTCMQINLSGELTFEKFIIYVENKFPENSCAYKEILIHEQLHVAHYKSDLMKIKSEVLDQFNEKYQGKILIFNGDPQVESIVKELGSYTSRRFNEISNQSAFKVDSNSTWKHIINRCLKEP